MIDEKKLIEQLKDYKSEWKLAKPFHEGIANGLQIAIEVTERQPTVDAVPVIRSEWKYYRKQGIAVCKNCSFERNVDDNFGSAISCPNCGAKMDGKKVECWQRITDLKCLIFLLIEKKNV